MKHKAKRIAREAGMPNCDPKTGAHLYVTPAPHGLAGDDRAIYRHHRDHVYHLALIKAQRAAGMPGPDRRRGARGAENRWRDLGRA